MRLLPDVLRFLGIFCAGIAAGTWVVTQLAVIPALSRFRDEDAISLLRSTEKGVVRFNPLCAVTSVIAGLLTLVLGLEPAGRAALLTALGCAAALGATLISLLWNQPLRRKITGERAGGPPPDYPRNQERWNRGNLARTFLGLVAFASYVLAAL